MFRLSIIEGNNMIICCYSERAKRKPHLLGRESGCPQSVAPEYIDYFFESKHFYCEIQKRLEGSVRQCLSFEGLCNIPLSLPSFEMQQRIGKRLFTLGQKIKTETDLLELLNKQKQYLLRQMFI